MPLSLSGNSSYTFLKSSSLTTPLISNKNELKILPAIPITSNNATNTITVDSANTSHSIETSFKDNYNLNNELIMKREKTSFISPIFLERRACSLDVDRNRRNSSKFINKKPVWFKTIILRLQQTETLLKNSQHRNHKTTSIFEECAQTPRHKTKEAEVLRQVGRFTIVRESEDFNTTMFDQCHCLQKPLNRKLSNQSFISSQPRSLPSLNNKSINSNFIHNSSNINLINKSPSTTTNNNNNNSSRAAASAAYTPTSCRSVLPTSASSPNLMNIHNRSKCRKFEVEWCSNSSPTSSSSGSSSSSSEAASSPASTISSLASSPGTNNININTLSSPITLSRHCKQGRKFEVTVISSGKV
ncbi:4223_t:CDS:2 [Diversispora eburnea]|uniref:4223_t:CDS:1 n=1 Tax=Diversispora eburnea TaxID=1213867 RepID=A0A9N9BWI6_9GLOM|nr:4223_t:CDS:2 [Diversispora eburnea]